MPESLLTRANRLDIRGSRSSYLATGSTLEQDIFRFESGEELRGWQARLVTTLFCANGLYPALPLAENVFQKAQAHRELALISAAVPHLNKTTLTTTGFEIVEHRHRQNGRDTRGFYVKYAWEPKWNLNLPEVKKPKPEVPTPLSPPAKIVDTAPTRKPIEEKKNLFEGLLTVERADQILYHKGKVIRYLLSCDNPQSTADIARAVFPDSTDSQVLNWTKDAIKAARGYLQPRFREHLKTLLIDGKGYYYLEDFSVSTLADKYTSPTTQTISAATTERLATPQTDIRPPITKEGVIELDDDLMALISVGALKYNGATVVYKDGRTTTIEVEPTVMEISKVFVHNWFARHGGDFAKISALVDRYAPRLADFTAAIQEEEAITEIVQDRGVEIENLMVTIYLNAQEGKLPEDFSLRSQEEIDEFRTFLFGLLEEWDGSHGRLVSLNQPASDEIPEDQQRELAIKSELREYLDLICNSGVRPIDRVRGPRISAILNIHHKYQEIAEGKKIMRPRPHIGSDYHPTFTLQDTIVYAYWAHNDQDLSPKQLKQFRRLAKVVIDEYIAENSTTQDSE